MDKVKKSITGDLRGGIEAALMGLPGNIIFGMLAFAPLGSEYLSFGILSSLIGTVIVGLTASLFGSTKYLISGPRPPSALLFASVMAGFSASLANIGITPNPFLVLTYGFIIAALSGVIQVIFGYFRLGSLVRFVPVTVISGFVAATAVIIILGQVWNISGIPPKNSLMEFTAFIGQIQYGAVAVAMFTVVVTWNAGLFSRRLPEGVLGIFFGTILYYSLSELYPDISFGGTLETTSVKIIEIISIPSQNLFTEFSWQPYYLAIISSAFGMALLASVDTLLTSAALDNSSLERSNHNQDLTAQGFANLFAACLGGLCGAGKMGVSLYALKSGAGSKIAAYVQAIIYIPIIIFALPYIDFLPNAVLGGVAAAIGIGLVDSSLVKEIIKTLGKKRKEYSLHQQFNAMIVLVIIFSTLLWDMITAMLLGVILSVVFFLFIFSGSIIRRELTGNAIQSIYRRNLNAQMVIDENRQSIVVLQLEGAVFFGSVELLARRLETLAEENVKFIVLDMRRVAEIDSTGASIIHHQQLMLREKGVHLLISYASSTSSLYPELNNQGVCHYNDQKLCFQDTSGAFVWCEDRILERQDSEDFTDNILSLREIELFHTLDENSLKDISHYLRKVSFPMDSIIFKQGDKGTFVLFIVKGNVEVYVDLPGMSHGKQLQILGPGTVVGEMALIDGNPRSANLKALNDVVCLTMTRKLYLQLLQEHPVIATRILSGFCQIFSERLRVANKMISELET